MMLYDYKQLPELRYLKTRHNNNDTYFDYEKSILDKSLSPHIFENDKVSQYLSQIQPLVSLMFDKFNIIKNFKNYMVDKYHYKQRG